MVKPPPDHPAPSSEYLELHAVSSSTHLHTNVEEEHTMTSRPNDLVMDDTSDTTPLQGDDPAYSKGKYRERTEEGCSVRAVFGPR